MALRSSIVLSLLAGILWYAGDAGAQSSASPSDSSSIPGASGAPLAAPKPHLSVNSTKFTFSSAISRDLKYWLTKPEDQFPFGMPVWTRLDEYIKAIETTDFDPIARTTLEDLVRRSAGKSPGEYEKILDRIHLFFEDQDQLLTSDKSIADQVPQNKPILFFTIDLISEQTYYEVVALLAQNALRWAEPRRPLTILEPEQVGGEEVLERVLTETYGVSSLEELTQSDWIIDTIYARQVFEDSLVQNEPTSPLRSRRLIPELQEKADQVNTLVRMLYQLATLEPNSIKGVKLEGRRPGIHPVGTCGALHIALPEPIYHYFRKVTQDYLIQIMTRFPIDIEVLRITDSDFMDDVLALRTTGTLAGISDNTRNLAPYRDSIYDWTVGTMISLANRNLGIQNAQDIANGLVPPSTQPLILGPAPTRGDRMPMVRVPRTFGPTYNLGAGPEFFDGSQQVVGFSYDGPDGRVDVSFELMDKIRNAWTRIENESVFSNLTPDSPTTSFQVPIALQTVEGLVGYVAPDTEKTVTTLESGSALTEESTGGIWLIINSIQYVPRNGESLILTAQEIKKTEALTKLEILVNDPAVDERDIESLFEAESEADSIQQIEAMFDARIHCKEDSDGHSPYQHLAITFMPNYSYEEILKDRLEDRLEHQLGRKIEDNSAFTMTYYSNEGVRTGPGRSQNSAFYQTVTIPGNQVTKVARNGSNFTSSVEERSRLWGVKRGDSQREERDMVTIAVRATLETGLRSRWKLDEGRRSTFYHLPTGREGAFRINLPFTGPTHHPLSVVSHYRFGSVFACFDEDKVPSPHYQSCSTRKRLIARIIGNSFNYDNFYIATLADRFLYLIRPLVSYDELFNNHKFSLRSSEDWQRLGSLWHAFLEGRRSDAAMRRFDDLLRRTGEILLPDSFINENLLASTHSWATPRHLTAREIELLRIDLAAHYLRFTEVIADGLVEFIATYYSGLPRYSAKNDKEFKDSLLDGYHDLILFDESKRPGLGEAAQVEAAAFWDGLKRGRKKIHQLDSLGRQAQGFIIRGTQILEK